MSDRIDVVVIGAGEARLAVSRELGRAGVAHSVLEKERVAQRSTPGEVTVSGTLPIGTRSTSAHVAARKANRL